MKYRLGHVANSSSSSFLVIGWFAEHLESDNVQKALTKFLEQNNLEIPIDEKITVDNFEDYFYEFTDKENIKIVCMEYDSTIGFDLYSADSIELKDFKKQIELFETKCKDKNNIYHILYSSINKEPQVFSGEQYC